MRVKWSSEARRQLVAIFRYAARDNPSAARSLVERLRSRVTQLRQHPLSGRMVPEMGNPALRELVEAPYHIIYTITTKPRSVVIVAVHHGKRRLGGTGDED